jgi:hypothetical protein
MTDPFRTPPGTNPPRHVPPANPARWAVIGLAIVLLLGVAFWEIGNRQDRSASNEEASTVGLSDRASRPAPVNPDVTPPPAYSR